MFFERNIGLNVMSTEIDIDHLSRKSNSDPLINYETIEKSTSSFLGCSCVYNQDSCYHCTFLVC